MFVKIFALKTESEDGNDVPREKENERGGEAFGFERIARPVITIKKKR